MFQTCVCGASNAYTRSVCNNTTMINCQHVLWMHQLCEGTMFNCQHLFWMHQMCACNIWSQTTFNWQEMLCGGKCCVLKIPTMFNCQQMFWIHQVRVCKDCARVQRFQTLVIVSLMQLMSNPTGVGHALQANQAQPIENREFYCVIRLQWPFLCIIVGHTPMETIFLGLDGGSGCPISRY